MNHSEFSTIYVLTKKMNKDPSPLFGFKHRGRAKLFALAIIDRELETTSLPSDVINAYKTIFLKTNEVIIPNHFTLTLEEIQYSEEG